MGFKEFLFRGNLVELAVAVVIGIAFGNLVTAFTSGMITPLLGIFGGQPSFKTMTFSINGSEFLYGNVIDAAVTFFITALVIYYVVVVPSNWVMDKFKKDEVSNQKPCPYCCSKIDLKAIKCPFCTSALEPAPEQVATLESETETEEAKSKLLEKNRIAPAPEV